MLRMYDLAGAEEARRFSPYCWRVRLAVAHKGVDMETVPWRFTEKAALAPSGQERVPVLVDGAAWISDSWAIAGHLEQRFPEAPSLFGPPPGRALTRLHAVFGDVLVGAIARFILCDVHAHLDARDRAYFRASREQRFGATLEAVVADRDARLPAFRDSLAPLRATLKAQPFLGGERPLYADYAVFGAFQWARCTSRYRLVEADDPVAQWRERLLDAFGGLARAAPGYDA
ncbi:MAG: glutathione S-transferase family protein [Burkholderiales bacterium]|nr:glutathione S-transferase family protein [Burkholderiales bacterium]